MITHAHADHIGGMNFVLANFRPRELWLGVDSPSPDCKRLLSEAQAFGRTRSLPESRGRTSNRRRHRAHARARA